MTHLEQIERGIDFIEAHLDEDIDLRAVSKAAGMSHYHFQRMFKALTGETLKFYVRARRMANAMEMLLGTELRILDIALSAGYESQEAFSRAFKARFGMTPTAYRSQGRGKLSLKKVRLDPYRHTFGPDIEIYGDGWIPNSPESVMGYGSPIR